MITADAKTINGVVRELAEQHGFFHTDHGTSVQINLHDHMNIGTDGNIHLSADHTDFVQAPADAHVTPAYHPEAHAVPHAETKTMPMARQPEHPITIESNVPTAEPHPETLIPHVETPTSHPEVPATSPGSKRMLLRIRLIIMIME